MCKTTFGLQGKCNPIPIFFFLPIYGLCRFLFSSLQALRRLLFTETDLPNEVGVLINEYQNYLSNDNVEH